MLELINNKIVCKVCNKELEITSSNYGNGYFAFLSHSCKDVHLRINSRKNCYSYDQAEQELFEDVVKSFSLCNVNKNSFNNSDYVKCLDCKHLFIKDGVYGFCMNGICTHHSSPVSPDDGCFDGISKYK